MPEVKSLTESNSVQDGARDSASLPNDSIPPAAATRASLRIRSKGKQKRYSDDIGEEEKVLSSSLPETSKNSMSLDSSKRTLEKKKKVQVLASSAAARTPKQRRRDLETTEMETDLDPPEIFDEFTNLDVLFGRGNHVNKLAGNLRFRRKVHPFREPYNATKDSREKRVVLLKAYEAVSEGGARFMDIVEWFPGKDTNKGIFRSASRPRALEKVAQALREPKWTPPPPEPDSVDIEKKDVVAKSSRKKTTSREVNSNFGTKHIKELIHPPAEEEQPKQLMAEEEQYKVLQFKHVLLFNAEEDDKEDSAQDPESVGGDSLSEPQKKSVLKPQKTRDTPPIKTDKKSKKPSATNKLKPSNRIRSYHKESDSPVEVLRLDELGDKDVLFGRGHHINANPGNVRFRKVILQNKPAYAKLPLTSKRPMAIDIYNEFGGRFLEAVSGTNVNAGKGLLFRKVALERCIEKICQALREKYSYVIPEPGSKKSLISSSSENSMENDEDEKSRGDAIPGPWSSCKKRKSCEGAQTDEDCQVLEESTCSKENQILNIGSQIAVYWPIDKTFYEAVVEDLRNAPERKGQNIPRGSRVMMYYIRYTLDGQCEWIDLNEHTYKTLSVAPEKLPLKAGQVVRIMKSGHAKRHIARRTLFWHSEKSTPEETKGASSSSVIPTAPSESSTLQ